MNNQVKDIDDVDDDLFISKKPQNYIFAAEKKAADITERTHKMLLNTRSMVAETENIGQSTLGMLSEQRESLERAENNLDNINAATRYTQKQLKNMKSFFGGFKSLFSNSNSNPPPIFQSNMKGNPADSSAISGSVVGMSKSATVTNFTRPMTSNEIPALSNGRTNSISAASSKTDGARDIYDESLSEIGHGLGRLKEMALRLGDEIGDQNDMLDRITDKSERAGDSIKHQNRQMEHILKKG